MKKKLALLCVFGIIAVIAIIKIFGETISAKYGSANSAVVSDISFGGSESMEEVKEVVEESGQGGNGKKAKTGKTWKRSDKDINMPTVFIGDKEQLPLKGAQISVKVDGFRARVLVDAFFFSDSSSQMEGTFKMRLPQGASPHYLAFGESVYLDNKKDGDNIPFLGEGIDSDSDVEESRGEYLFSTKVARVVPKEKAAFAYGQTVQRRVDPALSEWAGADVFNFRIFPLMPKKLHRVVVGYDVNLTSVNSDWVYQFPIPTKDSPLVVDFDIAKIPGVVVGITPEQKTKTQNNRIKFRLKNPKQGELSVRYRGLENFGLHHDEVGKYFGLTLTPKIPVAENTSVGENAIIALDLSLSSSPDKFNVWLNLVSAILLNNKGTIKRFNVILFNIENYWWKNGYVENTPENVRAFLAYANTLALEGATDLNHLFSTISKTPWAEDSADNIFLLSDGADTWGEDDSYEMVKNINSNDRLFGFNTGMSGTAVDKLSHFSRSSGGAVFAVNGEDEVQAASTAFRKKVWKIEKIRVEGAEDILIAGRPRHLFEGQKLMVTGRGMLSKSANVELVLSQNNQKKVVKLEVSNILDSTLSRRVYGQIATATLEEFGYTTERNSIAYARYFEVPGKTCSLLMLESEADYARFKISRENDGAVVKETPVNKVVADVLKNIELSLGSAKNKFNAWLDKLSKTDGLRFSQGEALKNMIRTTPEKEFVVLQRQLLTRAKTTDSQSSEFRKTLAEAQLDYDKIVAESNSRKERYSKGDALKVLSSLVEKNPGNTTLTRDVAYSALDWGFDEQAYFLFRRVLKMRPYEPQTYLAIAKALEKSDNDALAMIYYEIILATGWDNRFGAFMRIASLDYLHFLRKKKSQKGFLFHDLAATRYKKLRSKLDQSSADLMVVISWNTDSTDIDLHVSEPSGEECYYSNRNTAIGGKMTQDVTTGYGPEMYVLETAPAGNFNVRVKYFASNRNRASTRTKVYGTIYRNWGRDNESVSTKVVSLEGKEQMHDIISIDIKK